MRAVAQALVMARWRFVDFVALTKPRIAVLVLFTVAAGACLAHRGQASLAVVLHAVLGTGLVAAAASVLNQYLERHSDALMFRTENRPLPAGRLSAAEALAFGLLLAGTGLLYLALTVPPLTTLLAAFTLVSYVALYTPLKRFTTLNTLVGAVPGAMPPVIGWSAVTGTVDFEASILFLVVFLWQVPHFLAIAWIYREDYARGGHRMLPVVDAEGSLTGRQMVVYCLALVPVSLLPLLSGRVGVMYAIAACVLGFAFTAETLGFVRDRSNRAARRVLHASLIYLPALLALWLLEARFSGQ
jgi:protoheme IX farnesyltransferase